MMGDAPFISIIDIKSFKTIKNNALVVLGSKMQKLRKWINHFKR